MSIAVGESGEREFVVTDAVLEHFAEACGDRNPLHFDDDYAAGTRFGGRIAHGMLTAGFISSVLANDLPGPGTVYLGQEIAFKAPVRPGGHRASAGRAGRAERRGRAVFATTAWVGETLVADGRATVSCPACRAAFAPTVFG